MKYLFWSLILLCSLTSDAQTDKRLNNIREQLQGKWELESLEDQFIPENDLPWIQFLSGDRLAVVERGRTEFMSFTIALSESDTFLLFDEFTLRLHSSFVDQRWLANTLYFVGDGSPKEKIAKYGPGIPLPITLANAYVITDDQNAWTIYPPTVAVPEVDLQLNHDMSFQWDHLGSGNWSLDSVNGILHFDCGQGLILFEIAGFDKRMIQLRPKGIKHADSLWTFSSVEGLISQYEYSVVADSIRMADSIAAATAYYEDYFWYDLENDPSAFGKKFQGSWEAQFEEFIEYEAYQFVWDEKGSLLIRSGKKEKKYHWEFMSVNGNSGKIKLLRSGKEELALIEFNYSAVFHRITLTDPFTGKLTSFLLKKETLEH